MSDQALSNPEGKGAEIIQIRDRMTGRSEGGEPPDKHNWLADIEVGTYFLISKRTDKDPLEVCEVFMNGKTHIHAHLIFNMPDKSFPMWVKLRKYSEEYKLEEVVRLPIDSLDKPIKDTEE